MAGERHHKANSAETTLCSAFVDHRLLNGSKRSVGWIDALDRNDMLARCVSERHKTRGHRAVADPVIREFSHEDRTGTAVTLAAADLRAFQVVPVADEVKHGDTRGIVGAYLLII